MADSHVSPMSTPPLSRGSNFQQMLELERRYKLERLHSTTEIFDVPISPIDPLSPRVPLQIRRANSLSQQQQDLMLKAPRQSLVPVSLPINIPSPKEDEKSNNSGSRPRTQERRRKAESEPGLADSGNIEPLHKSVKFLAADSEDEDEESDQSSICQSPSWEGYGQKKKDKKKELERKKKEKDQKGRAERDVKAAKKRSSRLSKAPPSALQPMPTVTESANPAPVPDASHYSVASRGHRTSVKEDELQHARPRTQRISMVAPRSPEAAVMLHSMGKEFVGGLKLQQERDPASKAAAHSQFAYAGAAELRPRMNKAHSTVPGVDMYYHANSTGSSVRNESRSSRESLPPSSSRTHMLRHAPTQQGPAKVFVRGRDTNTHRAASSTHSSTNNSADIHQGSSEERGRKNSYVRHQRDQSAERALAGFVDEQLFSGATARSSSSSARSSLSRSRRSSITQEVKAVALRLTGQKPGSVKQREPAVNLPEEQQRDQFASFDQAQPAVEALSRPPPSPLELPKTDWQQKEATIIQATQARTASNAPSSSDSAASGKTRSLKDVARAALHMAPSSPSQSPFMKPTIKPPPYYLLRQRFSSSSSVPSVRSLTLSSTSTTQSNKPPKSSQTQPGLASASTANQTAKRVSEGSSASSNCDDVSPLPSPVTTPDSSRPQSVKEGGEPRGMTPDSSVQDDGRTIRLSPEAGDGERSLESTPREDKYKGADGMPPRGQWAQTATPAEIDDTDAKSTASDYEDAEEMPTQTRSTPVTSPAQVGKNEKTQWFSKSGSSFSLPYHLAEQASQPNLVDIGVRKEPLVVASKPPLLKARPSTGANDRTRMNSKQETENQGQQEPEQKKRKLRKQVPEAKAEKPKDDQAEVVERRGEDDRVFVTLMSPNTTTLSARFMSPIGGFVPSYGFASNPFFVDFDNVKKTGSAPDQASDPVTVTATQDNLTQIQSSEPPPAPTSTHPAKAIEPTSALLKSAAAHVPTEEQQQPALLPPLARSTTAPISRLRSPAQRFNPQLRPQVLAAVPKHLQQPSTATSSSQQQGVVTEPQDLAPVAKMFVECCSCRFYHDMPSKVYECMANPDGLVEDKLRGISGAITTMVKCPWCQHNMSTECCAGYAAVVYIKEKLH